MSPLENLTSTLLDRLIHNLSTVYTAPNLLIIDRLVAPIVDFLTTILKLRSLAKFDNLVYLDSPLDKDTLDQYKGLILILDSSNRAANEVFELLKKFPTKKIHVIVKDMTRLFVYNVSNLL
jgi:hypothetical protein